MHQMAESRHFRQPLLRLPLVKCIAIEEYDGHPRQERSLLLSATQTPSYSHECTKKVGVTAYKFRRKPKSCRRRLTKRQSSPVYHHQANPLPQA
ncbi:hypothetical protein KC19_VG198000 [Ceratodon purpureus]|uniref:Uncharacterized protein n=1 Tax=Ceratodon purpureus TaxID=3225 RepID=A0A8T0HRP6_CERPU|nr:hypothetical protein KC19_VG198000 [Ceratodon purpureus]